MKRLIVNADDCNLTPGVTRGILLAHDRGVVSSTTLLINLPLEDSTIQEIKKRKRLGLGLHLNVTLGIPVTLPTRIPSLVQPDGRFRRPADYFKKMSSVQEVAREYEAQIRLFERRFKRRPDHLDTHHHLHDHPPFFAAISETAKRWKLPIRRCRVFQLSEYAKGVQDLRTTDYLFGNLEARYIWQLEPFLGVVRNLPEGTSEIGCHPGFCDRQLREISSFQDAREKELKLFSDRRLRKEVLALGVDLVRFSEI